MSSPTTLPALDDGLRIAVVHPLLLLLLRRSSGARRDVGRA
jgi:hypothetical protein